MNLLKALLFDTRSIQRYIYSSNRLRANIGASYLVDRVFRVELLETLWSIMGTEQVDAETWKEVEAPDWTVMGTDCRIAYIGGGNALVLFKNDVAEDKILNIVSAFTEKLLQTHPGLRTGAAYGMMRLDAEGHYFDENGNQQEGSNPNNCLTQLVHQLKHWQSSVFPEVNVPYTGLTQLCPELGEAATAWDEKEGFCSWELESKRKAGEGAAKGRIFEKLQKVLSKEKEKCETLSQYTFPDELEKLGQKETESYIAIVHIDGNNMGERFARCDTLTARKNLSQRLSETTARAFAEMLLEAAEEYGSYAKFLQLGTENKAKILPVRPLVLGGDDMTFICTAKLALRYTRRVMKAMLDGKGGEESIDTCAGIAIQPESYPFFRGYNLAEQACDAAKKEMRKLRSEKKAEKSCWLDFVIRHGEQAPTLEGIRKQEYRTREGYVMHFGPYRVDAADQKAEERALKNLTDGLDVLKKEYDDERRLAMGKIKKLRDIIRHGDRHEWQKYLQRLKERGDRLPYVEAWSDYEEDLWKNKTTPYVDLIEMLDFYEPEGGKANG